VTFENAAFALAIELKWLISDVARHAFSRNHENTAFALRVAPQNESPERPVRFAGPHAVQVDARFDLDPSAGNPFGLSPVKIGQRR
jgi:hypothetical protein